MIGLSFIEGVGKKIAKGKAKGTIKEIAEKVGLTTKKIVGLMVSSLFILIMGGMLLVPAAVDLFQAMHWGIPLAVLLWAVYLCVLGATFLVLPILMLTGGVSATLLPVLESKWLRKSLTFLSNKGVWINVALLLVLMVASVTSGTVGILLFLFALIVGHILLWFFVRPIRMVAKKAVKSMLPSA